MLSIMNAFIFFISYFLFLQVQGVYCSILTDYKLCDRCCFWSRRL